MLRVTKPIKGRLVGASILCFCVDPLYGRVYFLLGKERHNSRWPSGSGKWSDFGGSTGEAETDAQSAAREFMEETLGIVKYFEHDTLPRTAWHDVAADLQAGNYTFRMSQGDKTRKFVTFVKQIPWDAEAPHRFSMYRAALTRPRRLEPTPGIDLTHHPALTHMSTTVKKEFLEKKVISMWSVPQLRRAVEHEGVMTHRGGYVEQCRPRFLERLEIILEQLAFILPDTLEEM